MGNSPTTSPRLFSQAQPATGVTRIYVIGATTSHHTGRARQIADLIQKTYPQKYETWYSFVPWSEWSKPDGFLHQVKTQRLNITSADHPLYAHKSSPFVWIEKEGTTVPLGGRDRFVEWVHSQEDFKNNESAEIRALAAEPSVLDAWVDESPGSCQ